MLIRELQVFLKITCLLFRYAIFNNLGTRGELITGQFVSATD